MFVSLSVAKVVIIFVTTKIKSHLFSNKMYLYYFLHLFFLNIAIIMRLVAHPGARTWCHALSWWALHCSLSSRTANSLNKNTLIMIMQDPAEGVEPSQRPCRARDGVECYLCTVMLSIASQSIYTSVEPFNTEITSVSLL